jgi:hypothetical protein
MMWKVIVEAFELGLKDSEPSHLSILFLIPKVSCHDGFMPILKAKALERFRVPGSFIH